VGFRGRAAGVAFARKRAPAPFFGPLAKEPPRWRVILFGMRQDSDDEALAKAAAAGDRGAFGALVERHLDRVFRLGLRMLGDRAAAEDLMQDVFAALPRKLARFDGRSRFTTWLHAVTLNAARDRLRREAARGRAEAAAGDADALRRAGDAARAEEREWLLDALAALAPDLRAAAVLVVGEGASHREAGAALGLSEGTVSWRMSEVRRALRARAAEEMR